jgi:hypothetical protein
VAAGDDKRMRLPVIGSPITRPLRLTHFRDLEELEGPLLSEYRDGAATYIEKWCTCDETTQRTLIVRSDQRSIAEYLGRRISMWELIVERSSNTGWLHDYTTDGFQRATLTEVSTLPENYLPSAKGLHDPTLRPRWERVPQEFLINQRWNAKILSEIEKKYLDVHAFTLAANQRPQLIHNSLSMNYNSGWTYYQAFRLLRSNVPREDRPDTVSAQAASPGVLSMDAPRHVAVEITRALIRVQDPRTRKAISKVHDWSRFKTEAAKDLPTSAVNDIKVLCGAMGIDAAALLPGDQLLSYRRAVVVTEVQEGKEPNRNSIVPEYSAPPPEDPEHTKKAILHAGKLLVGYCKRLRELMEPADGVQFIVDKSLADADDEDEDYDDEDVDIVEDEDYDDEEDEDYDDEDEP